MGSTPDYAEQQSLPRLHLCHLAGLWSWDFDRRWIVGLDDSPWHGGVHTDRPVGLDTDHKQLDSTAQPKLPASPVSLRRCRQQIRSGHRSGGRRIVWRSLLD